VKDEAKELGLSYAALMGDGTWETTQATAPQDAGPDSDAPPPVASIIEALLFVGGAPLTAKRAGEIVRGLTAEQFTQALDELNRTYHRQNRPYGIQPKDDGYVLTLRPKFHGVIEKIYGGQREARLSNLAIDVLALVAYRQPATKAEIDSLRGADSSALLRQLVRRGLVQVVYRADANQREVSYGTTPRFLEWFGLGSLDDLPRTQDLQQM